MYRVRWTGYEEKDDTWQPLTDLDGCKETVEEFHKEKGLTPPRWPRRMRAKTRELVYEDLFCVTICYVTGFGFVYELAGARSLFGEGGSVAGLERGPWRGPVASVVSSGPSGDGYKEEGRPRRLSLNQRCYYLLHDLNDLHDARDMDISRIPASTHLLQHDTDFLR
jgi:hypothetical protein